MPHLPQLSSTPNQHKTNLSSADVFQQQTTVDVINNLSIADKHQQQTKQKENVFCFLSSGGVMGKDGSWVKKTNHPLTRSSTNSTPYTCTQSHINAQTTEKSCQHSITSRYLSNSNLKLSTFSAATTFPGRQFHALSTL